MSTSTSHQTVRLGRGKHTSPAHGACVMELASMLGGEPFTDHPRSVCPVVASYLRALNDLMDDRQRQRLYPYAAAAVGTSGDESVQRARIETCRSALRDLGTRGPAPQRLLAKAAAAAPLGSPLALEHFTLRLVRLMRRSEEDWRRSALALADDLLGRTPLGGPGREGAAYLQADSLRSPVTPSRS
jgi:hypothetical protein